MPESQVASYDCQLKEGSLADQIEGFHQIEGGEDFLILILRDQQCPCPVAKCAFAKELTLASKVVPLLSSWGEQSLEAFEDCFPVPVATQGMSKTYEVRYDNPYFEGEFCLNAFYLCLELFL